MMENGRIQILLLEDSRDDADLLEIELQNAGLSVAITRCENLDEFERALASDGWDAIVSDYRLAGFTAVDALKRFRDADSDLPFIVISGAVGEETAVNLMKMGAHDFFLKDHLAKLGPAIQREMRDAALRAEHRRTVLQLRESEERFRMLADAAPVMIWQTNSSLDRSYFNRPWLEFSGQPLSSEACDGWRSRVHLDDRGSLREIDARMREQVPYAVEYRLRRFDGNYHWVLERGVPRYDPGGEFAGFIGSTVDVERLKAAEQQLSQAVESRDEFLAAAAHELRTPLTVLRLQLDVLFKKLGEVQGRDEIHEAHDKSQRQLDRLKKLVDTMLEITRFTAGKLDFRLKRVDLSALAKDVRDAHGRSIEHSGSSFEMDLEPNVIGLWDPVHIETVLSNLVSNAIKYGLGKPILVSVKRIQEHAEIVVQDHGIGIQDESKDRIFNKFERSATENAYSGLGIGLWLVKQIVEAHGGSVEVESRYGDGSIFKVQLPLVVENKHHATAS